MHRINFSFREDLVRKAEKEHIQEFAFYLKDFIIHIRKGRCFLTSVVSLNLSIEKLQHGGVLFDFIL